MRNVQMIHQEPGLVSIPVEKAVYCENCETVSTSAWRRCGLCWVGTNCRTGPSALRPLRPRNPARNVDQTGSPTCGLTCAFPHRDIHPRPPNTAGCSLAADLRNKCPKGCLVGRSRP